MDSASNVDFGVWLGMGRFGGHYHVGRSAGRIGRFGFETAFEAIGYKMKLSDPYNVSEFRSRATSVVILFSAMMGLLLLRLGYLQLWQGEVYREFSDKNRFKIERLSAPRGQILDRHGRLLADNRPRFDVLFTRGYAQNLDQEFETIAQVFHWTSEEKAKKAEKLLKSPRYQAQTVAQEVSMDELALLETKAVDLPGMDIEVVARRDFLFGPSFFHVIGYTGEVNDMELARLRERFPERDYKLGDQKGVMGIEALYEEWLRGTDGRDFIVVDVRGRRVNEDKWRMLPKTIREEPVSGRHLQLSLDLDLQEEAVKAFGSQTGAAVALDPQTGEVLAFVSRPSLDPNIFTKKVSDKQFESIMNDPENPFLDRVVGEHYPPGSTFKLLMAIAALETGVINENTTHFCPGFFRMGRRVWKCHLHEGHGRVNVVDAIERSCDVFFYNVAQALGLDNMFSWSTRFGLGRRTYVGSEILSDKQDRMIRFNSEQPGFIPYTDWVLARRNSSLEGETVNAGIGQGAYTVTMMQLARLISALGNGGKIFSPQLVSRALDSSGAIVRSFVPQLENQMTITPRDLDIVLTGMEKVVSGAQGTARLSRIPGIRFGGKTGTAQVVALEISKGSRNKNYVDHALFVGMAPLDNPKIAVAVIVEHGGHGSSAAAPIAKKMIQKYLEPHKEATGPEVKPEIKPETGSENARVE